jgi:hypothetical protein
MATVTIKNLTRPGSTDFYAGEWWVVEITGAAPNQAVSVLRAGNERGYGTTDATGYFRMIGTMGREDIALWIEVWKVGGVDVPPTIQFRVRPARVDPSELPVEIPEGLWAHGQVGESLPFVIFVSDDETVKARASDLTMGVVAIESWAIPWNLSSTSVGSRLPALRRVYAY